MLKYSKWQRKFINFGLNNFFGNLQYYYCYTYSFMKLLVSLNYTNQNKILEFYQSYHLREILYWKKTKYIKVWNLCRKKRSLLVRFAERTGTWWQKLLGPDVTDNCWRKNFRMNKEYFFELAGLLESIIRAKGNSPNYRQLTIEEKMAIRCTVQRTLALYGWQPLHLEYINAPFRKHYLKFLRI